MLAALLSHFSRRRGFTLTEIGIVLGVMGVLLGGVWSATSTVNANKKLSRAQQELMTIASNVRKLYLGRGYLTCTSQTDITAQMIVAGVFPADMLVSGMTYPQSPWGGDVRLFACSDAISGDTTLFQIEFWATMQPSQCAPFLGRNVGASEDPNLVAVWDGVPVNGMIWIPGSSTNQDVTSFSGCDRAAFAFRL